MQLNKLNPVLPLLLLILSVEFGWSQGIAQQMPVRERAQYIQNAIEYRSRGEFTHALEQLNVVLSTHFNDPDALMLKGDILMQSQQFDLASSTYQKLLQLNNNSIQAQINLSYALFMDQKPRLALIEAKSAWEKDLLNQRAIVNYFNALLWNGRTSEAEEILMSQQSKLNRDQFLVMSARLYTSKGNYKKGHLFYDSLITSFTNNHYVNEYIEVLMSKKETIKAKRILNVAQAYLLEDDYHHILASINTPRENSLGVSMAHFKDIAENENLSYDFLWRSTLDSRTNIMVRSGWADIRSRDQDQAKTSHLGIQLKNKFSASLSGLTELRLQQFSFDTNLKHFAITGQQSLSFKPHDRIQMGLFLQSEILNFTASLLKRNIRIYRFGYQTHLMFNSHQGLYSKGGIGALSDGNRKIEIFGSLYNIFNRAPLIKAGVNVTALSFRKQNVTDYFSASRFLSSEIFIEYQSGMPGIKGLKLDLQAAIGTQQIEDLGWEPTYRIQSKLIYQHRHIETTFQYQTSNVASSLGTGYQFNRYSLSLIYHL